MNNLSGKLMAGNLVIANVENSTITSCNEKLVPMQILRTGNIELWLADRAIDNHRPNSRLLKKALRIKTAEEAQIALEVNGATITDNYWFCPTNCSKTYDDIKFSHNYFDSVALKGDPNGFSQQPSRTPELTNIGSYEKCWKIIDGKWWLYKSGTDKEYFSEIFISRLCKQLDIDTAWYEMDNGYIRTVDFTEGKVNFETMNGITGEDDDYDVCFKALFEISEDVAKDYLKLIWVDTLCYNMDRHTKNFGILRDRDTGDVISLAPNYDNNIALISRGYVNDISRKNDGLIRFFSDFIENNDVAAAELNKMLDSGVVKLLDEKVISSVMQEIADDFEEIIEESSDYLKSFILNGQNRMRDIVKEKYKEKSIHISKDFEIE